MTEYLLEERVNKLERHMDRLERDMGYEEEPVRADQIDQVNERLDRMLNLLTDYKTLFKTKP